MSGARRIVFATFGSLGDVHPYIALALQLKRRGHAPLIVTCDMHREVIGAAGIDFAPMSPGAAEMGDPAVVIERLLHPVRGPQYLIRDIMMPHVRAAYEDIDRVSADADLLVSHPLSFGVRLVAEKRSLPWVSTVLAPLSLMSALDPPLFGVAPWLFQLRRLGVMPYRAVFGVVKRMVRRWEEPLHQLRAALNLPPLSTSVQFEEQFAARGTLALFSRVLAAPQADWPPATVVCGFPRYDGAAIEPGLKHELDTWLAAGLPPLVFTLGSSVSMAASGFFPQAIACAARLRQRALLITGQDPAALDATIAAAGVAPGTIKVFRYLPYSVVFPHAAVNVHQGGVGTLAQALAAGRPQLVTPVAFDQPDNARRTVALGVARSVAFQKLSAETMVSAVQALQDDSNAALNAASVACIIADEDRVARAAEVLEAAANSRSGRPA